MCRQREESPLGSNDDEIWHAAQKAGRILVTQDLDFSDIRPFTPGIHHGLVLIRLREPGRVGLARRIREAFATEPVQTWESSFVVITDLKTRVRASKF